MMTRSPEFEKYWTNTISEYRGWGGDRIPDYMVEGLMRWIVYGKPHGGFLRAVLSNNLFEAVSKADENNSRCLKVYTMFLYNRAPRGSWGSAENYKEWIRHNGLVGLNKEVTNVDV